MAVRVSAFKWIGIVGIAIVFTACKHSIENPSLPKSQVSNCDTSNVTYALSVKPILRDSCYSCHSSAISQSQGVMDLEDFASLSDYLKQPYQLDTNMGVKFMHVINQKGSVPDMPPTGKLTDCELSAISIWIRKGALNN